MQALRCTACGAVGETDVLDPSCPKCGSAVTLLDDGFPDVARNDLEGLPTGVWRYGKLLPAVDPESIVTLGEGGTPLLQAHRLGEELGLRSLFIKDESRNPTGSFLDRGSTVLLSLARARGIRECACVTTGNLGASLSAYCAKAGVTARIRMHPNTDRGKLYQMLAYGAHIESPSFRGSGVARGALSVTAGNPYLLEGEKTTGFEILQDLEWKEPDVIVVPVGTGGHLSMIWRSISIFRSMGLVSASGCRLIGVQMNEGVLPTARRSGRRPKSEQGGLLMTELEEKVPYFVHDASKSIAESGGRTLAATAAETLESMRLLASTEGIFAEPSSASAVAALRRAVHDGLVSASDTVVCVITGAGLKDTNAVSRLARETRRSAVRDVYATPSSKVGETKVSLLRLLRRGPSYGYELWQEVGQARRISTASIYQHLAELESLSMVRKKGVATSRGRERVVYEITRRGLEFLRITNRLERG